jgi:hypothetical protein
MTSAQIKDAINIGIYNLTTDVNPIQFNTLFNTINDLFGIMVSAMKSFDYCISSDCLVNKDILKTDILKNNKKLIACIILSHAYAAFDSAKLYEHWPKTAISEYLGYFEDILLMYEN